MFDFDEMDEEESSRPAPVVVAVEVDEALKSRIEAAARECASREDLKKWAFKYPVMGFPLPAGQCKLRIFCFHNAGSAESVYTGPAQNPVVKWVKGEPKQVEMISVSYPGRDKMMKDPKHETTDSLNTAMLPVLFPKLTDGVPFVFWAHSVGTWVAHDLLRMMQKCGMPMPQAVIFNAFPSPDIPEADRPWTRNRSMSSAKFKDEVKGWDVAHFGGAASMVFEEPAWTQTWEPIMRADFRLFDEYEYRCAGFPKFPFPIHSISMEGDANVRPEMIERWAEFTDSFHFEVLRDMGHLTSAYVPAKKNEYFTKVHEVIQRYFSP